MNKQIEATPGKNWTHRSDNRQRLIDAGYSVLSEKGIEATTVKEIARIAAVSPGLFHYYFSSKDELLFAVLQEAGKRFKQHFVEVLHTTTSPLDFANVAIAIFKDVPQNEITWYRLRYEFYSLGLRNADFLPSIAQFLAYIRQEIAHTIQISTHVDEKRAQALAATFLACLDGLALQQIAQPDLDLTAAYTLMAQLVTASLVTVS